MSEALLYGIGAAIVLVVVIVIAAVRIVNEYERGVIFRLGRIMGAKGPGLFFIVPIIDRMVKVNLQTVTHDIPPQDVITKDNVTLRVNAVTYFNVIDPVKAVVAIQNYFVATTAMLTSSPGASSNRKMPLSTSAAVPPAAATPMPGANSSATNKAAASPSSSSPTAFTGRTDSEKSASSMSTAPTAPPPPTPGLASS